MTLQTNSPGSEAFAPGVALISLGCAKNMVDTEELLGSLYHKNFRLLSEPQEADIVIINTCGFIQSSIDESRGTIEEMLEMKSTEQVKAVYAMGCYASRSADDIMTSYPGLDGVFPLSETQQMINEIHGRFRPEHYGPPLAGIRPISATMPHYSYLKISEGCNRSCTYCTIPSIRGPNVDKPIPKLVEEAQGLVERGVRELNIIAQDTTAYGVSYYGEPRLLELLQYLTQVEGLEWIRLLYAYPDYLSDELADFLVDSPKILPYLELPIQHVSESVLRRMYRPDSFKIYDRLFDRLRERQKDFCLRTTVIVGFPGETEEEFKTMEDYLDFRGFDRLGAFKYHCEEGTPAAKMKDQVPADIIDERYDRIMSRQAERHLKANRELLGKDMSFIVDSVSKDTSKGLGRTWRDAVEIDSQIQLESSIPLYPGMIATCRVTDTADYDLIGVL